MFADRGRLDVLVNGVYLPGEVEEVETEDNHPCHAADKYDANKLWPSP